MDNRNVAHKWANNEESKGSNFKSVKSEFCLVPNDDILKREYTKVIKIYSYSTCIGIYFTDLNFYLVTSSRYSNTTSKHQSYIRSALPNGGNIIYIDHSVNEFTSIPCVHSWLKEVIREYERIKLNCPSLRAKKQCAEWLLSLESLVNSINEIESFLGHYFMDATKELFKNFIDSHNNLDTKELRESVERFKKEKKEREEKLFIERLAKWRVFDKEIYSIHHDLTFLRFNPELERVETSRNITLSLEEFKNLYQLFKANKLEIGMKLKDNYVLHAINSKYILSGCHKIQITEIERLANEVVDLHISNK